MTPTKRSIVLLAVALNVAAAVLPASAATLDQIEAPGIADDLQAPRGQDAERPRGEDPKMPRGLVAK